MSKLASICLFTVAMFVGTIAMQKDIYVLNYIALTIAGVSGVIFGYEGEEK